MPMPDGERSLFVLYFFPMKVYNKGAKGLPRCSARQSKNGGRMSCRLCRIEKERMKSMSVKKMWILLLAVVLVAAIALGVVVSKKNSLQNELTEMNDKVAALTAQVDAAAADSEAAAAAAREEAETAAKAELEAVQTELDTAKSDLEAAKAELETVKAELDAVKAEAESAANAAVVAEEAEATEAPVEEVKAEEPEVTEAPAEEAKAEETEAEATPEATAEPTAEPAPTEDPAAVALAEAKKSGKIIVTLWHSFTKGQLDMMNTIAAEFNAQSDKYYVNAQYQPNSGLTTKVMNAVLAGEGPDLFFNYASEAANYVDPEDEDNTLVVDLAQYIYDEEIGIADFDNAVESVIVEEAKSFADGKMHILPLVRTGPIFYYNKTIFDELDLAVPTTWEELAEVAKTIREKKGIYGFAADSLTDMMQALIMQHGSEYIDMETKTAKINNEITVNAIKWYGEQVKAGYFMAAPTSLYYSDDMNNQTVACYIGSCAGIPYLYAEENGWELGVTATPVWFDATSNWYPAWDRGFMMFKSNDEQQLGAYEFLKFFAAPEQNIRWCQAVICLSPFKATQALPEYTKLIEDNPALQALSECLPNAGFLPNIKGASTVRDELQSMAKMAGDESNTQTVEEMVAAAEITCNEALQAE